MYKNSCRFFYIVYTFIYSYKNYCKILDVGISVVYRFPFCPKYIICV